jgi:hypothetical protein
MSFLRIATLLAAITSLLVFALDTASFVVEFSNNSHFLAGAGAMRLAQFIAWPLFYLALTVFFTALFVRQKG